MKGEIIPFNIDRFVKIMEKRFREGTPPILTLIAKRGATPFQVLVSTILSLRTKDEVTATACDNLFQVARTPREILNLEEGKLKELIYPVGFYP
ncbi:MAG: endonuclease III, partial [Thermodesulfobacteriota bacterium]|nr:endonuclease III [Thermodesulfobacteriota bacterium]